MPVAFGGVVFFIIGLLVLAAVAWVVIGYMRAGVEAAQDGIDPEEDDHPDAGHVAGPPPNR
jgi:uncharacterized membrane protein